MTEISIKRPGGGKNKVYFYFYALYVYVLVIKFMIDLMQTCDCIHLLIHNKLLQEEVAMLLQSISNNIKSFNDIDTFLSIPLLEIPDCLITESQLGEVDGVTLVKLLRMKGITTPIVVISGESDNLNDVKNIIRAGANDYIEQPVPGNVFIRRVQELLNTNKQQYLN